MALAMICVSSKVMEDMRDAVRIENAKKMLEDGVAIEKDAEYSGLSVGKIRELAGLKTA